MYGEEILLQKDLWRKDDDTSEGKTSSVPTTVPRNAMYIDASELSSTIKTIIMQCLCCACAASRFSTQSLQFEVSCDFLRARPESESAVEECHDHDDDDDEAGHDDDGFSCERGLTRQSPM